MIAADPVEAQGVGSKPRDEPDDEGNSTHGISNHEISATSSSSFTTHKPQNLTKR